MKLITSLSAEQLASYEESGLIELGGEKFQVGDILIFREAKEGTESLSNRFISIALDCNLTDDLLNEGLAREVINRIQKTRKDLNFNVEDYISIKYQATERLLKVIEHHQRYIQKETLCKELSVEKDLSNTIDFTIDNEQLSISITRI